MKHLFTFLFAFCLVAVVPHQAEAKRFGGGFSLGKSYSMPKKAAPAPTKQVAPSQTGSKTAPTSTAGGKAGMGGLMGGLLAGGILGALFFGGAFEGIQLMDMLLIGLVICMLIKLFGAQRRTAYTGASQAGYAPNEVPMARNAEQGFGSASNTSNLSATFAKIDTPEWFDEEAFLEGAKNHFKNLQNAWDRQDWQEIASYTSSELLQSLKSNRMVLPENQVTEVVSVDVELANFQTLLGEHIVSLYFEGEVRENGSSNSTPFAEAWHLSRDADLATGNWTIVGIEQVS
jgi:predicted lipid-binding transport protein (Tim44 family)